MYESAGLIKPGAVFLLLLAFSVLPGAAQDNMVFVPLGTEAIPTNEVSSLYQDSEGFVWIVTTTGIVRYDGYCARLYSGGNDGQNVPDADFHRIVESGNSLYIATARGCMKLDKAEARISRIDDPVINDVNISDIEKDASGQIWLAGDKGLYRKNSAEDSFVRISLLPAGEEDPVTDIIDILTDDGNLWITSWNRGLFRYDLKAGKLYSFHTDDLASSYVLHIDRRGNLWIGTWGKGLLMVDSSDKSCDTLDYVCFRHDPAREDSILDNIIYDIDDGRDGSIWVGSRSGLSIIGSRDGIFRDSFRNSFPGDAPENLPYNEVNSILRTTDSTFFLGMYGGGVCKVESRVPGFRMIGLDKVQKDYRTSAVRSICMTDSRKWWLGISGHGLIRYDSATGDYVNYRNIPEFNGFLSTSTVDNIVMSRDSSRIFFGSYTAGVWSYDTRSGQTRVISTVNSPDLNNDCITALAEDPYGNLWIGTRAGVYVLGADNTVRPLCRYIEKDGPNPEYHVNSIGFDSSGNAWLATSYDGIVRVSSGRGMETCQVGGKVLSGGFNCIFTDTCDRIWAGSMRDGLFLYDVGKEDFIPMSSLVFLEGQPITNITEDPYGNIWVTTGTTAVSLRPDGEGSVSPGWFYNIAASGKPCQFSRNVSCYLPDTDEMLFGCSYGLCLFPCNPEKDLERPSSVVLTGMSVNNGPYAACDVNYMDRVVLPHDCNDILLSFSLLDYSTAPGDIYWYRLSGSGRKDAEWNMVSGASPSAALYGLRPGKYVFEVAGQRAGKSGMGSVRSLQIRISPSPWLAWWSVLAYFLAAAGLSWFVFWFVRSRYRMKRRIELHQMNRQKIQEINQARLQFFTNVSHEFLTPLSIILASIENLSPRSEQDRNILNVMSTNTIRLTRLVQQVLEFRKVETDNLRIRVSRRDAAEFVRNCVEAFIPLVRKHQLSISCSSEPGHITGWFDSDKLDKIIYNLISNAVKYTPQNGKVEVSTRLEDGDMLVISCANEGKLMSQKTISGLFRRFYEGEYRKFNTIGTGIGLSLVKSLVEMHHGSISVESNEQVGNCFTVRIPIARDRYSDEEIEADDGTGIGISENPPLAMSADRPVSKSDATVLCVDDNEDMCDMISVILSKRFNVLTAFSAGQAIEMLSCHTVDAVVTDVAMPGMDGLELCSYIKGHVEYSHIPVIMLTAKADGQHHVEGLEHGADGYLAKPCNFSVLAAMIDNFLKRQKKQGEKFQNQLVFGVKDIDYTSVDKKFLQQAIDVVNAHIADSEFSQGDFVSAMAMSRTVLTEKLKSLTGLTPSAFMVNARLTAAYKLLTEQGGNIRVSDLAYSVGFSDAKYFSKKFKAKYGKSPRDIMNGNSVK